MSLMGLGSVVDALNNATVMAVVIRDLASPSRLLNKF